MQHLLDLYGQFYWLFVIVGGFIGVFSVTMFIATGKWSDVMRWLRKHTDTSEGEDFAKFFTGLGVFLSPVALAFGNVWILPFFMAGVLGLICSSNARQRRAVRETMERSR